MYAYSRDGQVSEKPAGRMGFGLAGRHDTGTNYCWWPECLVSATWSATACQSPHQRCKTGALTGRMLALLTSLPLTCARAMDETCSSGTISLKPTSFLAVLLIPCTPIGSCQKMTLQVSTPWLLQQDGQQLLHHAPDRERQRLIRWLPRP